MQTLDAYTVAVACIGALALALRGNMLKPEVKPWSSSRAASLVTILLSIVMAGEAIDIWVHGGATQREAWLVTAVAISSVVMLANLWAQRQQPEQS